MQTTSSTIVVSVGAKNFGVEEVRAREVRRQCQSSFQHLAGALHVAFLDGAASDIDPTVGIIGIGFSDFLECGSCGLQIALQKESDTVVVPALPFFFANDGLRGFGGRAARNNGKRDLILGNRDDRQIRNLLFFRRDSAQRSGKESLAVIEIRGDRTLLRRIRDTGERFMSAVPRELAIAEASVQRNLISSVLGNVHAVVDWVCSTGWNQPLIYHGAGRPGITFV